MRCVFFRSEEQARAHRKMTSWPPGTYLTMPQAALMVRVAQAGLFAMHDLA